MHILALEPYYGGSHRAFLDGWSSASRHTWTKLTLPAHHWKWRMRHAPLTFAQQLETQTDARFDLIFCSDMLNLATFRGLASGHVARLPAVVYFHENQLTYPDAFQTERDFHYAYDNFQTMLAADAIWFNSAYHRDEFFSQCRAFLRKLPDYSQEAQLDQVESRVRVAVPGLPEIVSPTRPVRFQQPHIVWAARWEHDKNPDDFFAALRQLKRAGESFRLSVVGESFRDVPPIFSQARQEFATEIHQWGYLPSHADYVALLQSADLFVSTAVHEFFGISAAEAILAGCLPVLPQRLAYPELVDGRSHLLYDGSVDSLAQHLRRLLHEKEFRSTAIKQHTVSQTKLAQLRWQLLALKYDDLLSATSQPASEIPRA
ncbi:DUF3524 domain-containing protein [Bremerella cremea]|uniref:tRNA-queuosine alpha-mannosyltransferase n=2 Tax=Bremerella cremea TaxID=1031537 RepID=A0A368KLK3_9BACT|nr:DUF3524 domain-containing protein [Bremerella cremea]